MSTTVAARPARVASSRIRELLRLVDRPGVLSMAGGLPAPEALDAERVRAAASRALDRTGPLGPVALQYGPTEGTNELRELLADRAGTSVDAVLVTTGSQQAIDLLARTICRPGDVAVLEVPSYLGALQSFGAAGVELVSIEGDDRGILVDHLAATLASGLRPAAVYVVPNFHNPTGAVLDDDRRRQLAALAEQHGFLIIEDDPYGELWFDAPPPPSLATSTDRVVRLGSASKVLAPGLRVGWMIGPPAIVEAASRLKQAVDLHTPSLNQLIVADLLGHPSHDQHLTSLRERYRARAHALDAELDAQLGSRLQWQPPRGGMFTWARLADGTDADELFTRAIARDVAFVPGSAFTDDPTRCRDALRLSFATLTPDQIHSAVTRLAAALDEPA